MIRPTPVHALPLLLTLMTATAPAALGAAQPASFEEVVRNLRNPDAKTRMTSLRYLRQAEHVEASVPIAALVTDPVDDIQLEAIGTLLSFALVKDVPSKRYVALVVEVRSKGQAAAAFAAGPLAAWPRPAPPEVVDALLTAVDDENPRVRTEAIYTLGVVAKPPLAAAPAGRLIKALDHYDPSIREAAAKVIGRLRVETAGEALIAAVNDSRPPVRYASMLALGDIRESRAVQALTEQFTFYEKGEGAWASLTALARIAHPSSGPLFVQRLGDRDPSLRVAAAEGIARLGESGQLETLQNGASGDPSPAVRIAMTFALVKLGQNYLPRLVYGLGSEKTAAQTEGYLLELGPGIVRELTAQLSEPEPLVRGRLAAIVGALGDESAVPALEALTRDRDRDVAEAAATAITRIRTPR